MFYLNIEIFSTPHQGHVVANAQKFKFIRQVLSLSITWKTFGNQQKLKWGSNSTVAFLGVGQSTRLVEKFVSRCKNLLKNEPKFKFFLILKEVFKEKEEKDVSGKIL